MPAGLSAPARTSLPAAGKRSLLRPRRGGTSAKTRVCWVGWRERPSWSPWGHPSAGRAQEVPLPPGAPSQAPCPVPATPFADPRLAAVTLPAPNAGSVPRGCSWEAKPSPRCPGWEGRDRAHGCPRPGRIPAWRGSSASRSITEHLSLPELSLSTLE